MSVTQCVLTEASTEYITALRGFAFLFFGVCNRGIAVSWSTHRALFVVLCLTRQHLCSLELPGCRAEVSKLLIAPSVGHGVLLSRPLSRLW